MLVLTLVKELKYGTAGTDLTGWIIPYNGNGGVSYTPELYQA
jgi:hypothetical protein